MRLRFYFAGAALGSAVLFSGAMTHPALAQWTLQAVANAVTCHSASPCVSGANNGSGPGVQGTSRQDQGIVGRTSGTVAAAPGLAGVLGQDLARPQNAHFNAGVSGTSIVGVGVTGTSSRAAGVSGSSGLGEAVFGTASQNNGIEGDTSNPSKTLRGASGVYGFDGSADGGTRNVGVGGYSINGAGVAGNSQNGAGVSGNSPAADGVDGSTANPSNGGLGAGGVVGIDGSTDGGTFNIGVEGYSGSGTGVVAVGRMLFGSGNEAFNADGHGNVTIYGLIYTAGKCSSGCAKRKRQISYTPRQSLPTMEDYGQARLVNGQAHVTFDKAFASGIDRRAKYLVFTGAEGDNRGLYVTNKGATSFAVREADGGRSTLTFSYRIVAKPYGSTEKRLPIIETNTMPASFPAAVRAHISRALSRMNRRNVHSYTSQG